MKFLYLILFISLASCTITKRVHQPGFHIEWKKRYSATTGNKSETKNPESIREEATEYAMLPEDNNENQSTSVDSIQESEPELEVIDTPEFEKEALHPTHQSVAEKFTTRSYNRTPTVVKPDPLSENSGNTLAIISFVVALILLLMCILPLLGIFIPFATVIVIFSLILALVLSILSLTIGKNDPETYTLRGLALASLILVLVIILLAIFIVTLFLLLFAL